MTAGRRRPDGPAGGTSEGIYSAMTTEAEELVVPDVT